MFPQDIYLAKINLESFSDSDLQSLIHYYYYSHFQNSLQSKEFPMKIRALPEFLKASRNDTLWLLALEIHANRQAQHPRFARMPKLEDILHLEELPPEMVYQICLQANIPELQRFVATSKRHRVLCVKVLERKIEPYKKVAEWLNANTQRYAETTWQELVNLTELNLRYDRLSRLPPEIGNLTKLTDLDLTINQLTSLPATIGNLTKLKYLYTGNNQLTNLPAAIGNLTELTDLALGNNQLTSLPAEVGNLTNLTFLDLSDNQLTSLPANISNLTKLTFLNLSNNNQLTSLPAEIDNLTNLRGLHLGATQVTRDSLPKEFLQRMGNRITF